MVILHDGDETWHQECESIVASNGENASSAISLHRVEPGLSLGELRNRSVELAQGHLVCQWDDDDRSHPMRLSVQVAALIEADAQPVTSNNNCTALQTRVIGMWKIGRGNPIRETWCRAVHSFGATRCHATRRNRAAKTLRCSTP